MKDGDKARMTGIGRVVSAGLMKQPVGSHLDPESLSAFAENALSPVERESALNHLSVCADCRETLFLAQPAAAEQMVIVPARRNAIPLFRWAALTASVAVVAGGAFLARHEFQPGPRMIAKEISAEPYVGTDIKKSPALPSPQRALAVPATEPSEATGRPEPKHMTAKPQTKMEFDSSDQVHLSSGDAQTMVGPSANANKIQQNANPQVAAQALPLAAGNAPVNTGAGPLAKETVPPSLSLQLEAVQSTVQSGSPILFRITIKNTANRPLLVDINPATWFGAFDVQDSRGQRPLSRRTRVLAESQHKMAAGNELSVSSGPARQLLPGQSVTIDKVPMSDLYDLSQPGTYTIAVHHLDGLGGTVTSNPIEVTVAP